MRGGFPLPARRLLPPRGTDPGAPPAPARSPQPHRAPYTLLAPLLGSSPPPLAQCAAARGVGGPGTWGVSACVGVGAGVRLCAYGHECTWRVPGDGRVQAGMCRRGTCVGPNRCVCDHTYVFVFAPRVPVCLYLSAYRNVGGEYLYVGAICACMRVCV